MGVLLMGGNIPKPREGFTPVKPQSEKGPREGFVVVTPRSAASLGEDPHGAPLPELEPEKSDLPYHPDIDQQHKYDEDRKVPRYGVLDELADTAKGAARDALAIPDLALTVASAGVGEISGGVIAAIIAAGYGNEQANQFLNWVRSGYWEPKSKAGKEALGAVAFPFMEYGRLADFLATKATDNPYGQTAIYTALIGAAEVFPFKGSATAARQAARTFHKKIEDIKLQSERLGIDVSMGNMRDSVVTAAENLVPSRRAEGIPILREAIQKENIYARARKNAAYRSALKRRTYVNSRDIGVFAYGVRREINNDFLLTADMPSLQASLKALDDIGSYPVGSRIRLKEWERVRQQINKASPTNNSERMALSVLRRRMDDWLMSEFNSIALQQGQRIIPTGQSAISGDAAGVNAFINARELNKVWRENFSADKVIVDLINREASPTDFRQWLAGASTIGGRREAVQTMNRLRRVLGDNHPAIEAIRQDYLFELAMPLLEGTPNINKFVKNYEMTVLKQPDMIEAMGLRGTDLHALYDYAVVANRLPPNELTAAFRAIAPGSLPKKFLTSLSQFFLGHQIARGQLRVRLGRDVGAALLGLDRIGKRQLLEEVAGVRFDQPIAPPRGPVAAQFITAASLSELGYVKEAEGGLPELFPSLRDEK
jgi:hypothetical protein